jgi:N-acetylglucosaminyl-diphospho-decaprenol L-rhamnosyltransferase
MKADVSVVIATYNARNYIGECLSALRASNVQPAEIHVIDNASNDGTADFVAEQFPEADLVRNRDNVGFGVASNAGIRASRTGFVLLLNPDAVLAPESLGTLVRYLEKHPEAGIAGCRLRNLDGTLQHSIGRFPTLANQLGRMLFLHRLFPHTPSLQEIELTPGPYERTHDVEWLLGAVMLVRGEAMRQVGLFDERFFLFSEETDWCLRMREAGWHVAYVAETTVTHIGRGGVGAPEVYVHLLRSKYIFVAKHFGLPAALSMRALMLVGLAARYAGALVQSLAHTPLAMRRRRAFASGLRWALFERSV